MDNRNATQIDTHIVEIEKEIKRLSIHEGVIRDEYNKLRREEIELQQQKLEVMKKRQDIKIRLDKAKSIINDKEAELKLEIRAFWRAKDSGP